MRAVLFRLTVAESVLDALSGDFRVEYHLLVDWTRPVSIWAGDWKIGWHEHEDRLWQDVVKEYHVPSVVVLGGPHESEVVKECDLPDDLFKRWQEHREQTIALSKALVEFINHA